MPIRPIDVVKSHDISQYKQIQNQRSQHEQVQISKSFQNLIHEEASKTVNTTKSENKEFRYDAKEEGRNTYKGSGGKNKHDQKKQKREMKPNNNTGRPGGIDIQV